MILAAGRGERMRPLTDHRPKPLLEAAGEALIVRQIRRLHAAGIRELVVNHAHLGGQIEAALGDGARYGVRIRYSPEAPALETGGGIHQALPLLGPQPFLAVNGDVWCDLDYRRLQLAPGDLARIVLVDTPAWKARGDFALERDRVRAEGAADLTFAGIGLYHPGLFADCVPGAFPLAPLLRRAAAAGRCGGLYHRGGWSDIGTPERLAALERALLAADRTP